MASNSKKKLAFRRLFAILFASFALFFPLWLLIPGFRLIFRLDTERIEMEGGGGQRTRAGLARILRDVAA